MLQDNADRLRFGPFRCASGSSTTGQPVAVAYLGFLFRRGGSTNSVEDRENGELGAVAPWSGVLEAAVIWYKKFHFI